MRITVVYSTPTRRLLDTPYGATDEDSTTIARVVQMGLSARGHEVELMAITEDTIGEIKRIQADSVFNLIEWCGQDIALSRQAFAYLRELKIPVTGSSEELFVLTGDKARLKKVLVKLGAPTPRAQIFKTGHEKIESLSYPVIVKPSLEHCSVGLGQDAIAKDMGELRRIVQRQIEQFEQPVVAEEFIVGREFLVYILEERGEVRVLPIEEILFTSGDPLSFQTYESKWDENHADYSSSQVDLASLTRLEQEVVERTCTQVFKDLGLWGYARFDVRLRDGIPFILETNANPSVYDADEEIENAEEEVIWGIKFGDYLQKIVESALWHYARGEVV